VDIPRYAGPLIGRDIEVHAASTMLEVGGSPLVTISGLSGVGKTRVAAAVARTLADDLPGGVVWVDASTASSGDDVLERIAAVVDLHGTPEALRSALPRALGGRRTLVVVDGLEGIDAKGALAVVLGSGPRVSVIVTSSNRVGLASEQVLTLQALSTSGGASSPAAAFVVAALELLAPGVSFDASAMGAAVAQTGGVPSALEQVALDLISHH
jgi:predicted ATPase